MKKITVPISYLECERCLRHLRKCDGVRVVLTASGVTFRADSEPTDGELMAFPNHVIMSDEDASFQWTGRKLALFIVDEVHYQQAATGDSAEWRILPRLTP